MQSISTQGGVRGQLCYWGRGGRRTISKQGGVGGGFISKCY